MHHSFVRESELPEAIFQSTAVAKTKIMDPTKTVSKSSEIHTLAGVRCGHRNMYLFGDLHPSHIQEYAGGLLLALEKPAKDGGGIRPIICGESWRRCFASLAANAVNGCMGGYHVLN